MTDNNYVTAEFRKGGKRAYDTDKYKLGIGNDILLKSQVEKLVEQLETYRISHTTVNYQLTQLVKNDELVTINSKLMALVIYINHNNINLNDYDKNNYILQYATDNKLSMSNLKVHIIRYLDFLTNL